MLRRFSTLFLMLSMILAAPFACALAQEFAFPIQDQDTLRLTAIHISGNQKTDPGLIGRILGLRVGQTLTLDQMDQAWDRLEDCGFFRYVDLQYDDENEGEVVLNVVVEEDLTTYYGPVLRYDRRFKYLVGGYLEERNFRGRGEKLRLEAAGLYIQQAGLSWDRPWLFGQDGLHGRLAVSAREGDFVFRPTRFRKWDAVSDLRWGVLGPFYLGAGITFGQFEQRDGFSWPGTGAGAPVATHPAGIESHWLLEGTIGLDSRNNPFYPQRGVMLEVRARNWASNSFADYLETSLDARVFAPMPWRKQVLALHLWGRRTDGPSHLDNLLYFGGPETVRGLPFASREGDEGYLLSVEYRIPLFLMPISPKGEMVGFGVHVFADAGDAWFDGNDPGRAQQSFGGGAHLNLDTQQFRFEGARTSEGRWRFEFMDRFNF